MQVKLITTFEQAKREVSASVARIQKQTTVIGSQREIEALARLMLSLQARSPIKAEFQYDVKDVQAMDVSKHPRLQKMQKEVVREMLAEADNGDYYRGKPFLLPREHRIRRATPLLDVFMRQALAVSRGNQKRAVARRTRIFR